MRLVKGISWGVLPLVAGLFVLVEALGHTGVTQQLAGLLGDSARQSVAQATWVAGGVLRSGATW